MRIFRILARRKIPMGYICLVSNGFTTSFQKNITKRNTHMASLRHHIPDEMYTCDWQRVSGSAVFHGSLGPNGFVCISTAHNGLCTVSETSFNFILFFLEGAVLKRYPVEFLEVTLWSNALMKASLLHVVRTTSYSWYRFHTIPLLNVCGVKKKKKQKMWCKKTGNEAMPWRWRFSDIE